MAMEWDENSNFFHAAANGRRRKNSIHRLKLDGAVHTTHAAKSTILFDFYCNLLGSPPTTEWSFSLADLYPQPVVHEYELSAPFKSEEISKALFDMDINASPGPDGFGPSFYKAFWQNMKPHLMELFEAFYNGSLDLDGLNHAHLILLPKKDDACTPDNYRPISLQNCPMKLFTKVMANRLKPVIPTIIDADQTGFVHGRSIAENFIYAADLLGCCYKRKVPTAVLKLDFREVFDSVSWDSLDKILAARGFDDRWRRWVANVLTSGKTSVMLNGVPGRWLQCRRGLRQGDPLSPYLFIIIADVLQRLIQQASREGLLRHPISSDCTCPVLQYADDTLILVQGDTDSMRALKAILEKFSLATGLACNWACYKLSQVDFCAHAHPCGYG